MQGTTSAAVPRRSTAVEVALKMAFKKFAVDHGIATAGPEWQQLKVVALDGGYHGDTLGVMDCSPQSVFNAGQTPWYRPRGLFLEPPTLGLVRGSWQVSPPPPNIPVPPHPSTDMHTSLATSVSRCLMDCEGD